MADGRLGLTSSQTVGPFFSGGLLREDARRNVLVGPRTEGTRIRIEGQVLDGDGAPVPDAMVEIWQANAHGRYHHPLDTRPPARRGRIHRAALPALNQDFHGFGRSGTEEGGFWFETIKPGPVPFDGSTMQAPHLLVSVFARGILNHVVTRLYFDDEERNARDPLLQRVPTERRATLIAVSSPGAGTPVYRKDIVLQGSGETVFFNV